MEETTKEERVEESYRIIPGPHGVQDNPSTMVNTLGESSTSAGETRADAGRIENRAEDEEGYLVGATSEVKGNPLNEDDLPSPHLMSSQQEVDKDIGPVIRRLRSHDESTRLTKRGEQLWKVRKRLIIKDGLLVRLHRMHAGFEPIEQVVLPSCLKTMVLESLHDSILTGHFGVKRTKARVQLRYYWPGYLKDIEQWCETCDVCQRRKPPQSMNTAPLTSIDTGNNPFEQVALDIIKLPL